MANMIQPLTQPDQARAPQDHGPSAELTVVSDPAPTAVDDDSGLGLTLFVVFVSAVLLLTGAVAFLAVFTAWWMLGLVFGVDLLVTGVVGTTVFTVLGDGKHRHRGEGRGHLGALTNLKRPVHSPAPTGQASPFAA